jgi:hypothetical protein
VHCREERRRGGGRWSSASLCNARAMGNRPVGLLYGRIYWRRGISMRRQWRPGHHQRLHRLRQEDDGGRAVSRDGGRVASRDDGRARVGGRRPHPWHRCPATTGRRWRVGEHEGGVWRAERRRRKMPSEGSVLASQIHRVLDRKFKGFFQIIPIFSNYTYPVSFT